MTREPEAPSHSHSTQADLADFFLKCLGDIQHAAETICRRYSLTQEDSADFASRVMLKILDNDYAILRAYRGRSSIKTYIHIVVSNLLRDYRNHLWGKWRPSACALRLGPLAVDLERLVLRDGLEFNEACEVLRSRLSPQVSHSTLETLAAQLPPRLRRSFVQLCEDAPIAAPTSTSSPMRRLEERDRQGILNRAKAALLKALSELQDEDRVILHMNFAQGLTMATIAGRMGLKQRSLYTRRDRSLRILRRAFERQGLQWREIQSLIGWEALNMNLEYRPTDMSARDSSSGSSKPTKRSPETWFRAA